MNVRQAAQLVPFAGLLLLYAASAPRTVALEDDGAFILAGHFLGVAHPPGYPLHTLLAFLFDQLPLGSAAYRAHLLSGVFGALAAAVLFACTRAVGVRTTLAAGAALAFGLSRVFWSQAIVAEVYTLHVFLFALALLLALRLHRGEGGRGTFVGLAAATGLGLANHWPLMVLAGPALLLLVWRRWRDLLRLSVLACGALTAALPYAWMVLRSHQEPLISFYGPLRSAGDVWHLVLRQGYAGVDQQPLAGWDDRARLAQFVLGDWGAQLTLGGAALALLGLVWLWRRGDRTVAAAMAWSVVAVVLLLLVNLDFEYHAQSAATFRVYPLTAYAATAVLLGCGLEALARRLDGSRWRATCPALAATLVAVLGFSNAPANWRPHDDWGEAYARALLRETPADALLIADPDWAATTLGYVHFVEGQCPGCVLLQPQGLMFPSRLFDPVHTPPAEQAQRLARHFAEAGRPLAFTDRAPPGLTITDRWLVQVADPRTAQPSSIEFSGEAHEFFRRYVATDHRYDATIRTVQQELRRRYFEALAATGSIEPGELVSVCVEFYGCLGLAEGMLRQPARYARTDVGRVLAVAAARVPDDVHRWDRARLLELRRLAGAP
jgi:4-amino-4-deoxy-L-arabinose transferase-like glycosyltransferase